MNRIRIWSLGLASAVIALTSCTLFPSSRVAVVCYDETGSHASAFAGGYVITDIPSSEVEAAFAASIARLFYDAGPGDERPQQGNLAVAGDAGSRSERRFFVARYQENNGNLEDLHFQGDGIVFTDFPGTSSASALALEIGSSSPHFHANVFVAGKALDGEGHRFAVARYHWNGDLVRDFGGDGMVLTSFPGTDDAVGRAIAFVPTDDGFRIVVGGDVGLEGGRRFALARYRSDGHLDGDFDGDGRVTTDFPYSSTESISDLKVVNVAGEIRIVAAGRAFSDDLYRIALARYRWDGNLDPTFGNGGQVVIDVPGNDSSAAEALVVDDEGRVIVSGYARDAGGNDRFMVARFTEDGSPDPDFGSAGFSVIGFRGTTGAKAHGIDLDREGRILVAGQAFDAGWKFAVARFLPDGRLDPSFGGGGRVLTDLPTHNEIAHDVAANPVASQNGLVACAVGQAGN